MLPGALTLSDSMAYRSYVTVNGEVAPHATWSVSRELSGDLPAQVVAVSGVMQATGNIEWAGRSAVSDTSPNPWNPSAGWLPSPGDKVVIWAGEGETYWRQFTGIIDDVTGDVGSGFSASIVDEIDRLNARVSHDALLRVMPPLVNGGVRRGVCLNPVYFIDFALRGAGFYVTPPLENRPAISVPAQGSMWPERGGVIAASGFDSGSSHAAFRSAPWGYAASDFVVEYAPNVRLTPADAVELTVMVAPDHGGNYFQTAVYGSTTIQLAVSASRTVTGRLNGAFVGSFNMGSARVVSLVVKAGTWTFRTSNGDEIVRTAAVPSSPVMDKVIVSGDADARVAGIQVCYPATSTEFRPLEYTPSAVIEIGATGLLSLMDASPVIKPETCKELLQQIGDALLTAMWIDESGIFRVAPSDVLRARSSSSTVTTSNEISSLSWENSLLSLRSTVDVDYRMPLIDFSRWQNRLCYQGSNQTVESGQKVQEFISPSDDEDWIGISFDMPELGDVGSAFNSNHGLGSITGGTITDGETEIVGEPYLITTLSQVSPGTLKVTHEVTTLPSGFVMELRYPKESLTIWQRWWNEAFPMIRAFAIIGWRTATRTSPTRGPAYAPPLVHNVGPWASREDNTIVVDRIRDIIAGRVTTPSPTITGLTVRYDPRRQLGDVITISSPTFMGVNLTALVVGIENSAAGSYTQSLSVRIITATTTFTTYAQFNEAGGQLTHQQWNLLAPIPLTYAVFNTQPPEAP